MRCARRIAAGVLVLLLPAASLACLWDSETLKQERARFPTALELITGKFLRHSKEFYEWRIKDRQEKLKSDPKNVGYYDDIAVAYEKIGQHEKAIETILAKEEIEPGLYETYSNLGTFHILAGDFEKGLPYIDKALAIDPEAHFGREKYQKWLVEYAMTRMKNGQLAFPLRGGLSIGEDAPPATFGQYLARQLGKRQLTEEDVQAAVEGILGMMRFADHQNPLLLEALADVLIEGGPRTDAKQLAARALLQSSYVVSDSEASNAYRRLAEGIAGEQFRRHSLASVEAEFKKELAQADVWYAELKDKELRWINEGSDVEMHFDQLYASDPVVTDGWTPAWLAAVLLLLILGLVAIVLVCQRIGPSKSRRVSLESISP